MLGNLPLATWGQYAICPDEAVTKASWMPKMRTGPQREHEFDVVTEKDTHEKTHGASTGARFASFRANMVRKWRELTPTLSSFKALLTQDKRGRSDCETP